MRFVEWLFGVGLSLMSVIQDRLGYVEATHPSVDRHVASVLSALLWDGQSRIEARPYLGSLTIVNESG